MSDTPSPQKMKMVFFGAASRASISAFVIF
jgi:hypothetical protein